MFATNLYFPSEINLYQIAKKSLLSIVRESQTAKQIITKKTNEKLRILSIDGGGMRAILPAIILAELEEHLKKESGNPEASIVNHFDLFAGTSAGSILVTLYLTPSEEDPRKPKFTAKEVLELYLKDGCKCFTTKNSDLSKARTEKYCSSILEEKLQELLGKNTNMEQLLKPAFITAFNSVTETPVYFESWKKGTCKVWQVVRASAAAPGMFKPAIVKHFHKEQPLIDGSIFAVNPAMCAYALAKSTNFSSITNSNSSIAFPSSEDIILASLGTGKSASSKAHKGSMIRTMMKNLMSSGISLVDQQLNQVFSQQIEDAYYRFNPSLDTFQNIDSTEKNDIEVLHQAGINYLKENKNTLTNLVQSIL